MTGRQLAFCNALTAAGSFAALYDRHMRGLYGWPDQVLIVVAVLAAVLAVRAS